MRWMPVTIFICLLSLMAWARQEPHNPQIDAATADALESLQAEVLAAHITPDLTISGLLDRVGGRNEMEKSLRDAEQIGGARWLGDQTVQVRLSIDGNRVAETLLKIVRANPRQSPIPPEALQAQLRKLSDRVFSATGTSTAASDVERLRPPPSDSAWWGVSNADRRQALVAARDSAIQHVIDSLAPIEFYDGKTLSQALAEPAVGAAVRNWLVSRPVKSVEFRDNLTVHLSLAVPGDELWQVLKSALAGQKQFPVPATQAEWDRLQEQVTARVAPAVGIGVTQPPASHAAAAAVALPAQPPQWSTQDAQAQATSPARGSKLHTARAAEAIALEKLRHQLDALPLSGGLTLGQAAQRDPRIKQVVARELAHARPFQVDYGSKGAVTVHVALNLSDLWADLTGQR